MSLRVKLNQFKVIKSSSVKFARLEFRGLLKYSSHSVCQDNDVLDINEHFEWPVDCPVHHGEVLVVYLLTRSFCTTSVLGVYRLGLQIVVSDGQLTVIDSLLDEKNKPVSAYVHMDVFYTPPKPSKSIKLNLASSGNGSKEDSNMPAVHGSAQGSGQTNGQGQASNQNAGEGPSQSHGHGSGKCTVVSAGQGSSNSSDQSSATHSEDENPLDYLERSIANFERHIQITETVIDIEESGTREPVEESRGGKLKAVGKRLLSRGFSFSLEKSGQDVEKKRSSFLRNLIRFGRARLRDANRDEEEGLLDVAGALPDQSGQQSPATPDEVLVDTSDPKESKKKSKTSENQSPSLLKAGDYQICVTIIEARQLTGTNMDPVVCVQIGEARKFTSVKESTNCPYYNEYFVFDYHMPPIVLFDKIITLSVLHSRNFLRANKLLGCFKLDVATIWNQPDRQFYHKWATIIDPDDPAAGAKGYLKCDISVIGKGDTIKIPPKSEQDEDDIEANLLVPSGVTVERQRARFLIKIYRAEGLPRTNYSFIGNVRTAFTGERIEPVDSLVEVTFAGRSGRTTIRNNSYNPVWNEQLVFNDMFPPLCQRLKICIRDNTALNNIIATHFIDLNTISNDGDRGFLPTFGPAFLNFYGSTRGYSLLDPHDSLNLGMAEGVAFRGRLLVSIRTEIIDSLDQATAEVDLEPIMPLAEIGIERKEEFFLFAQIFDADVIDKRIVDKPLQFEISIGNAGNVIDGQSSSYKHAYDLVKIESEHLKAGTGYWQSTTNPSKALTKNKNYYYLPYWDTKPCMHIRSIWPDHRRRMFNSNRIAYILEDYEDRLNNAEVIVETEQDRAVIILKTALDNLLQASKAYKKEMEVAPLIGGTRLDRERQSLCLSVIDEVAVRSKSLKALVTRSSFKDRLQESYNLLNKMKRICEDPQHPMPDIFIWLISNGKRIAYQRIPARHIIYSNVTNERGKLCGQMQTLFLKWPGKKASQPSGWPIPVKISVFLWLGVVQDKKHFIEGLPPGYQLNNELKNIETLHSNPPASIFYAAKHVFQMRAYLYQARSLIGSDSSGLSDPFARVVLGDCTCSTQVIDETLSPTWDELLVFNDILIYSTMEQIKAHPPVIVIEIFDQDKVGKAEFIGRTTAKPHIKAFEDPYERPQFPPALEWYDLTRGDDRAGELLATFELLEIPNKDDVSLLPELPVARETNGKPPANTNKGPILPVPKGIRPSLSKYRIEVLFWGLRDVKRIHLLTVNNPRVDIECAGTIISSNIIHGSKKSSNFSSPLQFVEVELPDQELYRPPLTIRVVDCRSFGRITLVGTHTINSIQKYIFTPMTKREKNMEDRKKSMIQLQNVDLRANCIIQDDVYTIENDKDTTPMLPRERASGVNHGAIPKQFIGKRTNKRETSKKRKTSIESTLDEDDCGKDWWTKYFASVETMIEKEKAAKLERQIIHPVAGSYSDEGNIVHEEVHLPPTERERTKRRLERPTPKAKINVALQKQNQVPQSVIAQVYPHELEAVPEYEEFKEWLHSFELYRGKKTGQETDDDSRVVGGFKGAMKVYKWPLPKEISDPTITGLDANKGFFQNAPSNDPINVLVRVYIIKATDLHPMDINGKADPYIVLNFGSKRITDKENYVSKQLNPVFGKCFEYEATFPLDSMLTIQVLDWDLLGSDDLIGETKIDLENRFYSRHRATCGLPKKYEEQGYNRWRDAMKPTQILAKLCKDGKLDPPIYEDDRVRVGHTVFTMQLDDKELFSNPNTIQEQMALNVLLRWQEVPTIGTTLVTEHVETRLLYKPNKPGVEQGRLQLWIDMFPMDMPLPGPPLNISPRKPKSYEMRVIIWNTDDVILEDDAFFTGEKMSDIYVKGWIKGPDDCQSTDIHYRSLTGEGNFNWRFIYPFEYLEAEERIVISRKESVFSWDETECKIPARLELQVWDADHFSADDFLGALTLDLSRFPRGAKSSKHCTLEMLSTDGSVPMVNIFKQKRVKGWWPFYIKRDNEEMELTGKLEAEIHLLTKEEADKFPAGHGRSEPDALEKPSRPDASFMWILNPLKSIRYIIWHNHKWNILRISFILMIALLIFLLVYAVPGYTVKKLMGA